MNKKLLTAILALLTLAVLNTNKVVVSAPPVSPYIEVIPSDEAIMVNWNHTVSIQTDYSGSDVWGWNVKLTFDPSVLQCVEVINGDLITTAKDPSARFTYTVNNAIGEVSVGAYFYYVTPPAFTTSGPGTLADVIFTAVGTGYSNITLEKETVLQGYDIDNDLVYDIINGVIHPNNLGHGNIMSTIQGDATFDKTVDVFDILKLKYHRSGPPPGPGGFNPDADVNQDGLIDVFDILIAKAHLGESW